MTERTPHFTNRPNMCSAEYRKDGMNLIRAAERSDITKATVLLDRRANLIEYRGRHGITPLMAAAYPNPNLQMVEFLLERNANVHSMASTHDTALFLAVRTGDIALTRCLIERGSIINHENYMHQTPLWGAVRTDDLAMLKYLVEKKASLTHVDMTERTLLKHAVTHNSMKIVEYLLENNLASVNYETHRGHAAIHIASMYGYSRMMKLLLSYNANINAAYENDVVSGTALHIASFYGFTDVMKVLLDHGADMFCTKYRNKTPFALTLNVQHHRPPATGCLLEHLFDSDIWVCNHHEIFRDFPHEIQQQCIAIARLWSVREDAPTNTFLPLPVELLHALLCALLFAHYPV